MQERSWFLSTPRVECMCLSALRIVCVQLNIRPMDGSGQMCVLHTEDSTSLAFSDWQTNCLCFCVEESRDFLLNELGGWVFQT